MNWFILKDNLIILKNLFINIKMKKTDWNLIILEIRITSLKLQFLLNKNCYLKNKLKFTVKLMTLINCI
jgi:hypothetical protein